MLFDPARHEARDDTRWNEAAARAEIAAIVADAERALRPHTFWPMHPHDDFAPQEPPPKTMYLGAAGVLWALEHLANRGAAKLSRDYGEVWRAALDAYRAEPDTGAVVPSWFLGESFLLLQHYMRGGKSDGERLYEVVCANAANPSREIMWGSPGTMLAALFAFETTGEARWEALFREQADSLWRCWTRDPQSGSALWTQDLAGRQAPLFGAAHGFAGNAFVLLRGEHLLAQERRRELHARVATTTKELAVRQSGLANWPASGARPATHVQWCHGAPGFLLALAPRLTLGADGELDELFGEAGELVWQAGPSRKGACLCHGTDGNGLALLALHTRTGDTQWRERARTFAMHAIRQSRDNLRAFGHRRYSLWTGDLGLAVFLWACIDERAHMPGLDFASP